MSAYTCHISLQIFVYMKKTTVAKYLKLSLNVCAWPPFARAGPGYKHFCGAPLSDVCRNFWGDESSHDDRHRLCLKKQPSLGHQGRRKVIWEWTNLFKLCAILLNNVQHIFPGGTKIFQGGLRPIAPPLGYGPGFVPFVFYSCLSQVKFAIAVYKIQTPDCALKKYHYLNVAS